MSRPPVLFSPRWWRIAWLIVREAIDARRQTTCPMCGWVLGTNPTSCGECATHTRGDAMDDVEKTEAEWEEWEAAWPPPKPDPLVEPVHPDRTPDDEEGPWRR